MFAPEGPEDHTHYYLAGVLVVCIIVAGLVKLFLA